MHAHMITHVCSIELHMHTFATCHWYMHLIPACIGRSKFDKIKPDLHGTYANPGPTMTDVTDCGILVSNL